MRNCCYIFIYLQNFLNIKNIRLTIMIVLKSRIIILVIKALYF